MGSRKITIFFEGQEIDNYETNLTAMSSIYKPNKRMKLKLTSSFYTTKEQEFYDILGEYWLAELDNNIGSEQLGEVSFNRGIGSYMNHARNTFNANVFNIYHDGQYIVKSTHSHLINWGALGTAPIAPSFHEKVMSRTFEAVTVAGFGMLITSAI